MKIYSKLLEKIRNNKTKAKKAVGIVTIAVGLRYGSINSIPTNLSSNSTQQVEQVHNYVEENMHVINTDGKVKDALSHKSSSHLIKTGSGILIGNQQISEGLKSTLRIRSADFDKSGPGARANTGVRKTGQTASSGSSIFVKAYTPQHIYCNHYHKDGNIPYYRQAHKNICPPDDQGKYLKKDQDGYCVNERGKKFVRVEHQHKQGKFETPENQNDPVQEASEVTGTETTTLTTDIRKRQVHAKSKHRGLFENPDGSSIDTCTEFKDSQVRFLKDKSDSKYVSDCILLGEGLKPKDAACVIADKTQDCLVLEKTQRWNSETKSMEELPILDCVGPRRLSINQYEKFKRYGIIGSDGKNISQAQHGMRAKELMEIRSNQIDSFGDSATCSLNEE